MTRSFSLYPPSPPPVWGTELFDRILQKKSFPESEAIDLMRKIVDAVGTAKWCVAVCCC